MEEIKQHCEKVIQMLRLDYPAQLQYPGSIKKIYPGSIKKIYDVMLQILSCDELPDVDWVGMVRCFVDETTDYQNPVLFEIDKIAKLSKGK